MIHEPDLIDQLDALPKETFDGEVFRGTRQSLDPLASSYSGGRWMRRDGAGVLYTSLAREGALAEISFHWGQLTPRPTKPVMLHTLRVAAHRTLKLLRADLESLGVPESAYGGVNMPRTQEIGAAVAVTTLEEAQPWQGALHQFGGTAPQPRKQPALHADPAMAAPLTQREVCVSILRLVDRVWSSIFYPTHRAPRAH